MRWPSKPTLFLILMGLAALSAFVLPGAWTGWIRRPFQLASLVDWPIFRTAQRARDGLGSRGSTREAELERELELVRLQLAQQQGTLAAVQRVLDDLSGLRGQFPDAHVKLILAPIVSYDANPRRDTLQVLLNADQLGWVRAGQWVAAGVYETPTRENFARQWIIGQVSEVLTRSARIQLTTDPRFRAIARVGSLVSAADGGAWLSLHAEECSLQGVAGGDGRGRMVVSQATANYYAQGARVVVLPASRGLPYPMVVGRIVGAAARTDSALHFDLEVVPWSDARALSHVYIISGEP